MIKEEKVRVLEDIKNSLKDTDGIVLADFKGMTIQEQEELRKKIEKEGGIAKVIKNTLLKKALDDSRITGMDEFLKNNTIVFISKEDVLKLIKAAAEYSKQNGKLVLKAAYMEGKALDKTGVLAMADLPSRKELLAMIAGGLNSVISKFVGTINSIMIQFVGTIEALEKKKSS